VQFPIVPAGISVVLGAADGYLASRDINQNAGVTPALSKSKTLWLQGGAVGVGLVGEFMRWHPDITESLMFTGAALFAREFAFRTAQSNQTHPVVAQGYRAYVPGVMAPNTQQATAAGFAARQPAGSVA
jgi:hypothetical protein